MDRRYIVVAGLATLAAGALAYLYNSAQIDENADEKENHGHADVDGDAGGPQLAGATMPVDSSEKSVGGEKSPVSSGSGYGLSTSLSRMSTATPAEEDDEEEEAGDDEEGAEGEADEDENEGSAAARDLVQSIQLLNKFLTTGDGRALDRALASAIVHSGIAPLRVASVRIGIVARLFMAAKLCLDSVHEEDEPLPKDATKPQRRAHAAMSKRRKLFAAASLAKLMQILANYATTRESAPDRRVVLVGR